MTTNLLFQSIMKIIHFVCGLLLMALLTGLAAAANPVLTVKQDRFYLDGQPFDMWGVRVASATRDQALTDHLIAQLDEYKAHGVNTVTVFYQGASGAFYDPFSADGLRVDAGHQARMEQIIRAAADRGMVVIAGIFYQHAPFGLKDAEAVRNATRTVTRALKPFRNVIINIANEQNSRGWADSKASYDFQDPERIIELCRVVKETDPQRLVGGGGYDHAKSEIIGRAKDVDVLLFDTDGAALDSGALYDRFVQAGVVGKPIVNVEIFGGWTNQHARGKFAPEVRQIYFKEIDAAVARPGLYLFLHNTPWMQQAPLRYDLGQVDDGVRWYFDYVKARRAAPAPKSADLVFPEREWARDAQGLDVPKLEAALKAIAHGGNIAVIRNGYLVHSVGDIADSKNNIYSAMKSVTALVFARLLQQGRVSYDELLPRSDYPGGPRASFRHFLTMTSDYDLAPHAPGRHYAYNNLAMRFYGEYMRIKFYPHLTAAEMVEELLFKPIGHQDPMHVDPSPTVYGTPWAGGQHFSARDLARLGLLVLADGRWQGEQILPSEFCQALFKHQLPADATVSASTGTERTDQNAPSNQQAISAKLAEGYSFNWWCNDKGALGDGLPREITSARGRGGNYIIVVRPWRVVIAVTNNEPERRPGVEAYVKAVQGAWLK